MVCTIVQAPASPKFRAAKPTQQIAISSEASPTFGHGNANLNDYHYSFLYRNWFLIRSINIEKIAFALPNVGRLASPLIASRSNCTHLKEISPPQYHKYIDNTFRACGKDSPDKKPRARFIYIKIRVNQI